MRLPAIQEIITVNPRFNTTPSLIDMVTNRPEETVESYIYTPTLREQVGRILETIAQGRRGQGFWVQSEYGSGTTHFLANLTCLLLDRKGALWEKVRDKEICLFQRRVQGVRLFPVIMNLKGEGDDLAEVIEREMAKVVRECGLGGKVQVTTTEEVLTWYKRLQGEWREHIEAHFRRRFRASPSEFMEDQGEEEFAREILAYCREAGLRIDVATGVKHKYRRIYDQICTKESGYAGWLLVIDEFAEWQRKTQGTPAWSRAEDLLETLAHTLPSDEGKLIYVIVASQMPVPTKLFGAQESDRFITIELLADRNKTDYDFIVAQRIRTLSEEKLPEVDQFFEYYYKHYKFLHGKASKEYFRSIFPFQPRCFEVVRMMTTRELPGARFGIHIIHETLERPEMLAFQRLLTVTDLMVSQTLMDGLRAPGYERSLRAYQGAKALLDDLERDLSDEERQNLRRVLDTLFLWHIAYLDTPRPLILQELTDATLCSLEVLHDRADAVLLALGRLKELPHIKWDRGKDQILFVVPEEGIIDWEKEFKERRRRKTDPNEIVEAWVKALTLSPQETGGLTNSLFAQVEVGEVQKIKAEVNQVEYPGEVIVAEEWRPDYGAQLTDSSTHFRLIFLLKSATISKEEVLEKRIAICVPGELTEGAKEAARSYRALMDMESHYKGKPGVEAMQAREWITGKPGIKGKKQEVIEEIVGKQPGVFKAGQVVTKEGLLIDPRVVFAKPTHDGRAAYIAEQLLQHAYAERPLSWQRLKKTFTDAEARKVYAGLLQGEQGVQYRSAVLQFAEGLELVDPAEPTRFEPKACRVFEWLRAELLKPETGGRVPTWRLYRDLTQPPYGLLASQVSLYLLAFLRYGQPTVVLELRDRPKLTLADGQVPAGNRLTAHDIPLLDWKANLEQSVEALALSTEVSWNQVRPFTELLDPGFTQATSPAEERVQNEHLQKVLKAYQDAVAMIRPNLASLARELGGKVPEKVEQDLAIMEELAAAIHHAQFWERLKEHNLHEMVGQRPQAFADFVARFHRDKRCAEEGAKVVVARNYLAQMALPGSQPELEGERLILLEQLTFDAVLANPQRIPEWERRFTEIRDHKYAHLYQRHHRDLHKARREAKKQLESLSGRLEALKRLNTIEELGPPVGETLPTRLEKLLASPKVCSAPDPVPVQAAPVCPACKVGFDEAFDVEDIQQFQTELESALRTQMRRLSQGAIKQILAESGQSHVKKFIEIVQVADLMKLVELLDEELLGQVRQLLTLANIKTEPVSLKEALGLYATIEEGQIPKVLAAIQTYLEQAFQEAKTRNPGKKIRLSVK